MAGSSVLDLTYHIYPPKMSKLDCKTELSNDFFYWSLSCLEYNKNKKSIS